MPIAKLMQRNERMNLNKSARKSGCHNEQVFSQDSMKERSSFVVHSIFCAFECDSYLIKEEQKGGREIGFEAIKPRKE